jgi:DNA-binding NarL/FixJ family response regulator
MHLGSSYILLLAKQPQTLSVLTDLLKQNSCPVAITLSEEQAINHTLKSPPFLIIVVGDRKNWSRSLLGELRSQANAHQITLVALTDFHAPSWIYQEDNPGFDGFLVNPISSDILSSLVQSARTRQNWTVTPISVINS